MVLDLLSDGRLFCPFSFLLGFHVWEALHPHRLLHHIELRAVRFYFYIFVCVFLGGILVYAFVCYLFQRPTQAHVFKLYPVSREA